MCDHGTTQDHEADAFPEGAFEEELVCSGRWSRRLARQLRLLPHRIDRRTVAWARERRIRRRREQRARSFLGGADKLAVEACEVGPTEPGAPTLFDVWVRPAGAEFAFSDPSAALVLVGPRHRRARRAWERGTIVGSPVAFASYLVPAPVWTPYEGSLGLVLWQAGERDQGLAMLRRAATEARRALGDEHVKVTQLEANLREVEHHERGDSPDEDLGGD